MTAPLNLPHLGLLQSDGQPTVLADTEMDGAFAYWRGGSGRRYLFHVLDDDHDEMAVRSFNAVALLATRDATGQWIALWLGRGEDDGLDEALRLARRKGHVSIHIYGQASGERERLAVIDDIGGRMAPFRPYIPPILARAA